MLIATLGPWFGGLLAFCLLVFASWCVGEGGEILGKKYDASIVGGLIIAWLNTAPETIFFITALESNNPRFAVGAMSGSTIVVSTVAMGACYYFGTSARKAKSFVIQPMVKQQGTILLASVVLPLTITITGFNFWMGMLGVALYIVFVIWELLKSKSTSEDEKDYDLNEEPSDSSSEEQPTHKGVAFLVLGGVLIGFFSEPFITAIVEIASQAKVNPILLAFFLAPVASEMPEILESISLSRKGNLQNINIAISNLTGGTITKTTLLCGIFCFYGVRKEFEWESPNYSLSLILMSLSAMVAGGLGSLVATQRTWHGYLLLVTFFGVAVVQFFYNSTYTDSGTHIV